MPESYQHHLTPGIEAHSSPCQCFCKSAAYQARMSATAAVLGTCCHSIFCRSSDGIQHHVVTSLVDRPLCMSRLMRAQVCLHAGDERVRPGGAVQCVSQLRLQDLLADQGAV